MNVMKELADTLTRHAIAVADGAAINYRYHDQEEESARTFEINVNGKPLKVSILVTSLEVR